MSCSEAKSQKGALAYHAGLAAEHRIEQDYSQRGYCVAQRRWRGKAGEIDLILNDGNGLIFVEVKQSGSFDRAAEHVRPAQMQRICRSAEEYLARMPNGSLTDMRFDVALVNGRGEHRIIENAFGEG